jgi:hypothetical protein
MRTVHLGNMESDEVLRVLNEVELLKCQSRYSPHSLRIEDAILNKEERKLYIFTQYVSGKQEISNF